jgi:Rrf2 family protein
VLVTREGDYAVRCVLEVARSGRISAAEVARRQDISPTFLGKIVQSLARAGILATRRGVGGGIQLARPVESITLLQVIEAVEGSLAVNTCVGSSPMCTQLDTCPAFPVWCRVQEALNQALDVPFSRMLAGETIPEFAGMPDPHVSGNGRKRVASDIEQGVPTT